MRRKKTISEAVVVRAGYKTVTKRMDKEKTEYIHAKIGRTSIRHGEAR